MLSAYSFRKMPNFLWNHDLVIILMPTIRLATSIPLLKPHNKPFRIYYYCESTKCRQGKRGRLYRWTQEMEDH